MFFSAGRTLQTALVLVGLSAAPGFAQAPTTANISSAPRHTMELLFTSSVRGDGAAEITLSLAGPNGVEIHQERSLADRSVVSKTILAPVASSSPTHLSQTRLILEKDPGSECVVLVLHPLATPGKSIRLILPSEIMPRTGAISMGIINHPIDDPGGGGAGGGGCYPISYTSDRCGTITNCCPTTSVSIDGIRCTITCN